MARGDALLLLSLLWVTAFAVAGVVAGMRLRRHKASLLPEWPMWTVVGPGCYETSYDGIAYRITSMDGAWGYTAVLERKVHGEWRIIKKEEFHNLTLAKAKFQSWGDELPSIVEEVTGLV